MLADTGGATPPGEAANNEDRATPNA